MDWRDALKPPFDPAIEVVGLPIDNYDVEEAYLLQWSQLEQCTNPGEAREISIPLIRQLNGVMATLHRSKPVECNEIVERHDDGRLLRHRFMIAEAGQIRIRGSAVGIAIGGHEAPPQPSIAQQALLRPTDNITAAFEHMGRADNWHDLYKAFEAVEDHVGSRANLTRLGVSVAEVANFALNAQLVRHHESQQPNRIMSLTEGRQFVASIIRACL